ncbi:MAG TPA: hypothetical protein DHV17_05265 [Chitinophagaceae bacterium]|nr:hypothetical protein [Chitinophagaceae bacterium]
MPLAKGAWFRLNNVFLLKITFMEITLILHNLLRWAVLIFGAWTVLNALTGKFGNRSYSGNDNRSNLLFMISCDIQLLLGLILYFSGIWFEKMKGGGMAEVMKNKYDRFFTVEHLSMMLIAWILVHVGRSAVKRASTDSAKHSKMLVFFGIAFVLIIASIPWPFREEIARPLFRWFN